MIYVGTDIVPMGRIHNMIKQKGIRFLDHIFTDNEQKVCNQKSTPYIHYSGKFAAKEAVKKAIYRAKSSIQEHQIQLGTPFIHEIPERIEAVHTIIYLIFN